MAAFAVNRVLSPALHLRPRLLFISSSFRARSEYTSSRPVRFIPGTYLKDPPSKKPNGYKKMKKDVSDLDSEKKHEEPVNEGSGDPSDALEKWGFNYDELISSGHAMKWGENSSLGKLKEVGDLEAIISQQVEPPQIEDFSGIEQGFVDIDFEDDPEEIDEDESINECMFSEVNTTIDMRTRENVEKLAIELLSRRAFTTFELRKKLHGKKFPLGVVDSVISDMKSKGFLNDTLYAEAFSQSRWITSTWGPKRIKLALVQKGLSTREAEKASKHVFEEEESPGRVVGRQFQHGMSPAALDRLFLQVSKQWRRGEGVSYEKRKARIIRWLDYRGFTWGVIGLILKKLHSVFPT